MQIYLARWTSKLKKNTKKNIKAPFRNHGFGFGFSLRLRPIVWNPERVYAKHAQQCQNNSGAKLSGVESGAGAVVSKEDDGPNITRIQNVVLDWLLALRTNLQNKGKVIKQ